MNLYIALEGIEGTGKSSVQRAIAQHLRADGLDVETVREPGGGAIGEAIRNVLLHEDLAMHPWAEALLFAAQRAQLAADAIRPALERGAWVIGDRSVYSSLAYQGIGRALGLEAVRAVNVAGLGGTWPDLVVLLRASPTTGLRRQAVSDRIGAAGLSFVEAVAAGFDELAAAEPDRVVVVDAERPLDAVIAEVVTIIKGRM